MLKKAVIVWLAFGLLAFPVFAAKKTGKSFADVIVKETLSCKSGKGSFQLLFTNDKPANGGEWDGEGYEDIWLKAKRPELIGPRFDALPVAAEGQESPCGKWLASNAADAEGKVIAVPFLESDRPFDPQLGIVFVDARSGKLAGLARKLGNTAFKNREHVTPAIKAVPGGIEFLTWTARTDAGGGSATIRGQSVPVAETDLYYWKKTLFEKGRITTKVDSRATWETSGFRRFFKSRAAFEKAFGLAPDASRFANDSIVMSATLPALPKGGPGEVHCIQPTPDREIHQDRPWYCDDRK